MFSVCNEGLKSSLKTSLSFNYHKHSESDYNFISQTETLITSSFFAKSVKLDKASVEFSQSLSSVYINILFSFHLTQNFSLINGFFICFFLLILIHL